MKRRTAIPVVEPEARLGMARVVPVATRALHTLQPDDAAWRDGGLLQRFRDACVRVRPPYDATPQQIADICSALRAVGALPRVLPRAPAPAAIPGSALEPVLTLEQPLQVIERLVAEAVTEDPFELRRLVHECLAAAEQHKRVALQHATVDVGHITGVRLENWRCFRGVQELQLDAKMYSITAAGEDPERSNWLGKSSFLQAIVFALTGDYPSRTADGWLHGAEPRGGVDLEFSNGLFVSRWRHRGKSTRLEVTTHEGADPMTGAAAQRYLDEAVIDAATLQRTAYFEQKRTDAFVRMDPAECSGVVNAWLGIEWVAAAAQHASERLDQHTRECATLQRTAALARETHGDIPARLTRLGVEEAAAEAALATARAELVELQKREREWSVWRAAEKERQLRHDRIKTLQCKLAEPVEEQFDEREFEEVYSAVKRADAEVSTVEREHRDARRLEQRAFDGTCPVAGIECPARQQINDMAERGRELVHLATTRLQAVRRAQDSAHQRHKVVQNRRAEANRARGQREAMRHELLALQLVPEETAEQPDVAVVSEQLAAVQRHVDGCAQALADLRAESRQLQSRETELVRLSQRLEWLEPVVAVHRQAVQVLGRRGAQRVIAEAALQQIERTGNAALEAAGIELGFRISWAQETKQLADDCDDCGARFPSSAKVRQCERCGSTRGKKLAHQLRIEPTQRSGGADDLVGAMFQLSAANWLRRYHGTSWAVFLIDEPFGALDRANVRCLARHLGALLGRQFGALQAFIVAHHADVLESAPGRIHITSALGVSRIEVR